MSFENGDYSEIYKQIQESETQAKEVLLDFQEIYPGVLERGNLDSILEEKIRQSKRTSILSRLNEMKKQNDL